MKLYVFNPDADMALGNNEENYMAPATIRRMAEDLALLPVWYAQPGSGVLAPSAYNADYLKQMRQLFRLDVQLVTEPELSDYAEAQVMPWGWNPAIRKRLLKGGVLERKLPTATYMEQYRQIASRHTGAMLSFLLAMRSLDYTCGIPSILYDGNEDFDFLSEGGSESFQNFVVKSLWSSSGRGLRWCHRGLTKSTRNWCLRLLKEDGGFVIEPIYNKVEDFAMEFYSDGKGRLLFMGYSLFTTDEKGAYLGNLLVSDTRVEEWIQRYVPLEALIKIRSELQKILEDTIGEAYTGYLGVDMMVCHQDEGHTYAINPCVEVNVRMNMGIVARTINECFVASGSTGHFSIDYYPTHEALLERHEQDMESCPLVVKEGRIVSGYLSLVPITPKSRYRAFVSVHSE